MSCSYAMSQTVEIVSNFRPIIFGLKVRTRGPQPSICVRTLSLFTNNHHFRKGYKTYAHFSDLSILHAPFRQRKTKLKEDKRVRFGPICRVRSTVWPNICENIGPIFLKEERAVSSNINELMPNICENLQLCKFSHILGSLS
jgi:hypothetical protein